MSCARLSHINTTKALASQDKFVPLLCLSVLISAFTVFFAIMRPRHPMNRGV